MSQYSLGQHNYTQVDSIHLKPNYFADNQPNHTLRHRCFGSSCRSAVIINYHRPHKKAPAPSEITVRRHSEMCELKGGMVKCLLLVLRKALDTVQCDAW